MITFVWSCFQSINHIWSFAIAVHLAWYCFNLIVLLLNITFLNTSSPAIRTHQSGIPLLQDFFHLELHSDHQRSLNKGQNLIQDVNVMYCQVANIFISWFYWWWLKQSAIPESEAVSVTVSCVFLQQTRHFSPWYYLNCHHVTKF